MTIAFPAAAQRLVDPRSGYITPAWLQFLFALQSASSGSSGSIFLNVRDFGALGDGATDDYAAIAAAISKAQSNGPGTILFFPRGTYLHSQPIVVNGTTLSIYGEMAGWRFANGTAPAGLGSVLKYVGAPGATQFTFSLNQGGGVRHIAFDGNSLSVIGLSVQSCNYCIFEDLAAYSHTGIAIVSTCTSTGPSTQNCEWHTINADSAGGTACMKVMASGNSNTSGCRFFNMRFNPVGAADGLQLGDCDNNLFAGTFIFNSGGPGVGVHLLNEGFQARENIFMALLPGGGWVEDAAITNRNVIHGYDLSNGQPRPVSPNGCLTYSDTWGRYNVHGVGINPVDVGTGGAPINRFAKVFVASTFSNNASANITLGGSGTYTFHNADDGWTAMYLFESGSGIITLVASDNVNFVTGVDPGAGSGKIWIHASGGELVATNRIGSGKGFVISIDTFQSTPH